ncbi:MAG: hypothetical protein BHW65_00260 [Verrucomicrobia bacterium CAG:312_58_20]|nr:MAG: hypothetical protein BHW65_00260 [Verrucomicrobia bacterium CAG:312_58_20]
MNILYWGQICADFKAGRGEVKGKIWFTAMLRILSGASSAQVGLPRDRLGGAIPRQGRDLFSNAV